MAWKSPFRSCWNSHLNTLECDLICKWSFSIWSSTNEILTKGGWSHITLLLWKGASETDARRRRMRVNISIELEWCIYRPRQANSRSSVRSSFQVEPSFWTPCFWISNPRTVRNPFLFLKSSHSFFLLIYFVCLLVCLFSPALLRNWRTPWHQDPISIPSLVWLKESKLDCLQVKRLSQEPWSKQNGKGDSKQNIAKCSMLMRADGDHP